MTYLSGGFFALVVLITITYYSLPIRLRPYVLLTGSLVFYVLCGGWTVFQVIATSLVAFVFGRLLQSDKYLFGTKKIFLIISVIVIVLPWFLLKLPLDSVMIRLFGSKVVVIGISFYTLESISYLVNIYKKKTEASMNIISFLNYSLYFPKVVQGPISRYDELSPKINEGHSFDESNFKNGFLEILWGFFLKLVIADKALLIVDAVFGGYYTYGAAYAILGTVLYSIQLYTDFLGCVMILHGVSLLFGVDMFMNFNRPYMSVSFKEFWQRWHISLSGWLSDYIYIPLGGSHRGQIRRYLNLLITFIVSAFWHGVGITFLIWGFLHAVYRMVETATLANKDKKSIMDRLGAGKEDKEQKCHSLCNVLKRMLVFVFASLGWIFFRASSFNEAIKVLTACFRPSSIESLAEAGLIRDIMGYKEFAILIFTISLLIVKEAMNETNISFKRLIIKCPFFVRVIVYLAFIMFIVSFGTYGYGFNAADFIYGGF